MISLQVFSKLKKVYKTLNVLGVSVSHVDISETVWERS